MQVSLSKSKYCDIWQCPKIAWLKKYKPEEFQQDDNALARMKTGQEVGALARGLFGEYTDVTVCRDDQLDFSEMLCRTQIEMKKGTSVICEASFRYNGLFCAVDILKKEEEGWSIYEVKSSTKDDKDIYYADVAYQNYVLKKCGVNVCASYLVVINNKYIFDGELDISSFFKITDVTQKAEAEGALVESNLKLAQQILSSEQEPLIGLSKACKNPDYCGFWKYCTHSMPNPSVFDVYNLKFKKKLEYYDKGIVRFEDLLADSAMTNEMSLRQMEHHLFDRETYVDAEHIREFLDRLSYPLYFLDFETIQPVIPRYLGTRPYQQIPFQYSLHYIECEGGELKHREFLAEAGTDPRRALAEHLCEDIPMNVCVTAYNKQFECGRIRELAEAFPDLAEHLLNIRDNIVDLLIPFRSGWYYNRAMGGSFSIKSVLPALFPNDPELDYHVLEGVHHGGEAMALFPKLESMPQEEQEEARKNLLAYCKLDTLAMVKLWERLKEESE